MNLRGRFTLTFVLFSVGLTAAGGWVAWVVASRALEAELDQKLLQVAGAAADLGLQANVLLSLQPGDERAGGAWTAYQARLRTLRNSYVDAAQVFRRDGTAVVTSAPADSIPIGARLRWLEAYPVEVASAWEVGQATTPLFEGNDGRYYKYGLVRIEDSDAMLAVLMPADYRAPLTTFRRQVLLGSVAAAALAALLAWGLATNVARPLERLSKAALGIQRGRMDQPIAVEREDEIGRLARAMERMRTGIQQRDEHLRLMLSQVAHEIRNPLGGLELFASAARDTEDPEQRNQLLARVRSEVVALNDIVNEFLTFARPHRTEMQVHDLRAPIEEALDLAEGEARKNGVDVRFHPPEGPLVGLADPYQVKRVILNLVRNGAQAGGSVDVHAERSGEEIVISVRDDGPGVSPEVRDRIFEPFVTDKEQGAGLGLAIVKGIAEANGGSITLVEPGGNGSGGAEFRVTFKAAQTPASGGGTGTDDPRGAA